MGTRYIRLTDGTVYHYSDRLAKRRDATVVDEDAARAYFEKLGIKNALTEKAKAAKKAAPKKATAKKAEPKPDPDPEPVAEDKPVLEVSDEVKALLDDG